MIPQLFDDVFAQAPVQEAYSKVSSLIPDDLDEQGFEDLHQVLSNFVLRIVEITNTANLPSTSQAAWSNAATAFISQSRPVVSQQVEAFQYELTIMGMPEDLDLAPLGAVVMSHALQLMGR